MCAFNVILYFCYVLLDGFVDVFGGVGRISVHRQAFVHEFLVSGKKVKKQFLFEDKPFYAVCNNEVCDGEILLFHFFTQVIEHQFVQCFSVEVPLVYHVRTPSAFGFNQHQRHTAFGMNCSVDGRIGIAVCVDSICLVIESLFQKVADKRLVVFFFPLFVEVGKKGFQGFLELQAILVANVAPQVSSVNSLSWCEYFAHDGLWVRCCFQSKSNSFALSCL